MFVRAASRGKLFARNEVKGLSNIPSGLDSYYILREICNADNEFFIPIPRTVVFDCSLDGTFIISNAKNRLKFINQYTIDSNFKDRM